MTNYTGVRHDRKQFNACCSAASLPIIRTAAATIKIIA